MPGNNQHNLEQNKILISYFNKSQVTFFCKEIGMEFQELTPFQNKIAKKCKISSKEIPQFKT